MVNINKYIKSNIFEIDTLNEIKAGLYPKGNQVISGQQKFPTSSRQKRTLSIHLHFSREREKRLRVRQRHAPGFRVGQPAPPDAQ